MEIIDTFLFGLSSWASESILDTLLLNKIGKWLNVNLLHIIYTTFKPNDKERRWRM